MLTPASWYFFQLSSTRARRTMLMGQCETVTPALAHQLEVARQPNS